MPDSPQISEEARIHELTTRCVSLVLEHEEAADVPVRALLTDFVAAHASRVTAELRAENERLKAENEDLKNNQWTGLTDAEKFVLETKLLDLQRAHDSLLAMVDAHHFEAAEARALLYNGTDTFMANSSQLKKIDKILKKIAGIPSEIPPCAHSAGKDGGVE